MTRELRSMTGPVEQSGSQNSAVAANGLIEMFQSDTDFPVNDIVQKTGGESTYDSCLLPFVISLFW